MRPRSPSLTYPEIVIALFAVLAINVVQCEAQSEDTANELLERVQVTENGSSSRSDRDVAIQQIPFDKLTEPQQREVQTIVNSTDLFRRLPTLTFEVHPRVYQYFIDHPDVVVSIWRALNVSDYQMKQTGAKDYEADSGDGTLGVLEVLYHDENHQVILCHGEMTSPILKRKVRSEAVLHLTTVSAMDRGGRTFVTHRVDMFVAFPSQGFGTAAKLTKPISSAIMDRNFREVSLFVQMMSLAMTHQPDWVEELTGKLTGVMDIRKKELIDLTAHVFVANQERLKANAQQARKVAVKPADISAMK